MAILNRFIGSLKIYLTGSLFILLIHLSLGLFMAYELSVFYLSYSIGILFYLGSLICIFPVLHFFMKAKFSFLKTIGTFSFVAITFLCIHLWGVLRVGHSIATLDEFEARKSRLYISKFLLKRAGRDVSAHRQSLLRHQISQLDKVFLNNLKQ